MFMLCTICLNRYELNILIYIIIVHQWYQWTSMLTPQCNIKCITITGKYYPCAYKAMTQRSSPLLQYNIDSRSNTKKCTLQSYNDDSWI